MYIYAAPVKYKDETGKVKDKKNKLSEQDIEPELAEDYGLTNPENDVTTRCSGKTPFCGTRRRSMVLKRI